MLLAAVRVQIQVAGVVLDALLLLLNQAFQLFQLCLLLLLLPLLVLLLLLLLNALLFLFVIALHRGLLVETALERVIAVVQTLLGRLILLLLLLGFVILVVDAVIQLPVVVLLVVPVDVPHSWRKF